MLSQVEINKLQLERKYFIENGAQASYMEWLFSKGTNFTCYLRYLDSLGEEDKLENKIDVIRGIIYSIHRPLQFTFFYWTLLIFILHKFNFKKPVMKIILAHFILRTAGDVLDKIGDLLPRYYANTPVFDSNGLEISMDCIYDSSAKERHPLKWFITRQLAILFWFTGEIAGDWYPLLRTRAVARDQKSIWLVYFTCGIFNLSKIAIIILHFTFSPTKLYNEKGVYNKEQMNYFYFKYWVIHLIIIYSSVIYDISVFYVLKKYVFKIIKTESGFLKKFKTISEYRIIVSAIISILFLPLISITIIFKFYYLNKYHYHDLNFSFDEIRQSIANVQYFMIFIDQILLISSKKENSSKEESIHSKIYDKKSNLSYPNFHYHNLNNNSGTFSNVTLNNKSFQNSIFEYSNDVNINLSGRYNNSNNNSINSNNLNFGTKKFNKNNTLGNYDTNNDNTKWNYLK
ncbi:hypothetical protein H8356DRAFT_1314382 [Neocallimastix lanati (nom. inval.)]|uniref:Uncharacterized protein n=1 Tax=Neocallimastix californiae TaxID=1754190 RepID=A0A1Y2AUE2_9FUNG|nr:hypothetical protein H8356DRAFT_1314382 [Neocallimastix sp. JGI-2020a]ORY25900.1 hypothetical protein LY90DRAFT_514004 [Neocallimastix californiae]|eukprot:ORY25900.1 hypothetical protein LY90DRAFT_514004 [Neocallimastix californiae]